MTDGPLDMTINLFMSLYEKVYIFITVISIAVSFYSPDVYKTKSEFKKHHTVFLIVYDKDKN
jgi:hypothetical protein